VNRIVRRSTIVAVALATTLGAGAALADTSGISPESLKSALSSTRTANSSFANAVKSSTFGNAERFARYDLTNEDQSEFAALKAPGPAGGRVGILGPEHNGDIQFAVRPANTAFGDNASECESAPVKLADVGAAVRSLGGEPATAGDEATFAQALHLSDSPEALSNFKRFAANGELQGSPSFASLPVDDIAAIKSALSGSSDASSALSNGTSAPQLSSALQKR
jgi:hypothetical protein